MSHTMQRARSAFSQTATNFLEGLTVIEEMPSEPSTPIWIRSKSLTRDIDLGLLIHVVNDHVVACRIKSSLVVNVE
jgi:hypothetical protein